MAADQRRKRLNGVNGVDFGSKEPYRVKKKRSVLLDNSLDANSHIFLEWDNRRKKVVAKKEQIGLSWRDLKPFVNCGPHMQSMLTDVLSVPPEIYELNDLSEVLSCEVWQKSLSEKERKFLMQYLPKETDVDLVVEQLLDGDNFHFGNPFLEWGAAVCCGNLHPDAIIHKERCVKADRRAYYTELQRYHYDIIDYLQKLKETWEKCKDPEKDIVQKLWGRPRVDTEKRTSRVIDSPQELEQNFNAASESCSWNADEKACSSDNENSSILKARDSLKGTYGKAFGNEECRLASENVPNAGATAKRKDSTEKYNIHQTDGAKYMSYLKVSKKQHQIFTNMKRSGKSIQSRSLNRVLGNIKHLDVQPYEVFVEEEKKKLHAHWSQIAKDLPAAYVTWKQQQSKKREVIVSLERDLKDKLDCYTEDEGEQNSGDTWHDKDKFTKHSRDENAEIQKLGTVVQSLSGDKESDHKLHTEDFGNVQDSDQDKSPLEAAFPNGNSGIKTKATEDNAASVTGSPKNSTYWDVSSPVVSHVLKLTDAQDKSHSVPVSPKNQSSLRVLSPGGGRNYKLNNMEEDACSVRGSLRDQLSVTGSAVNESHILKVNNGDCVTDHCVSKPEDAPLAMTEKPRNDGVQDPWPAVRSGPVYFDSESGSHEYASTAGLGLLHPQLPEEQNNRFVALRSDLHEDDGIKNLLQGHSNESTFTSFPSPDRSDLLHAVFKSQAIPSPHNNQEQRQMGLGFQPRSDILMDSCQFSGQFSEQKRQNEAFLHENLPENLYCDGTRFLMSRQEHLRPNGIQDWNVGPLRMSVPLQPQLNGSELLSQNWFSGDHQLRNMWAGPSGIQSGGTTVDQSHNTADQSLFSVLSQCDQLRSNGQFLSTGPMEQYVAPPASFGMRMGGTTPRIISGLPQPLEYMGGPQDEMDSLNLSNQNPGLHDPMGKPFIRSWNQ